MSFEIGFEGSEIKESIDLRGGGGQWRIQVLLMGGHNFFYRKLYQQHSIYKQLDNKPFVRFVTSYLVPFSIFLFTRLFRIQEAAFKLQLDLLISVGPYKL